MKILLTYVIDEYNAESRLQNRIENKYTQTDSTGQCTLGICYIANGFKYYVSVYLTLYTVVMHFYYRLDDNEYDEF